MAVDPLRAKKRLPLGQIGRTTVHGLREEDGEDHGRISLHPRDGCVVAGGRTVSCRTSTVKSFRSCHDVLPTSEVRLPRPGLLADLLDEGLRATSVGALVIHDL